MSTADNNFSKQNIQNEESENYISIKDLLKICARNWYWFVVSVLVCLFAGYYYSLKTEPTYLRTASLLCRDDMKGTGAYDVSGIFNSFGIPTSRSDVYNELFVIKSPIIMEQVVSKLKLDVSYDKEGFFRKSTLYGDDVPFIVEFPEAENARVSLKMRLKNGSCQLTDFGTVSGGEWVEYDDEVNFNPQAIDTLSTPVGKIVVKPNASYAGAEENPDMTIDVSFTPMYSVVERLIASISSTQPEEHASIIDLAIEETSPRRANDILNTLIESYNQKWIDDRNEIARATSKFITERLNVIESELGNVDDNISDFKAKNLLPDIEAVSDIYLKRSAQNNEEVLKLTTQRQMAQYIKEYLSNPNYSTSLLPANSGVGSASIENQIAEYNKAMLNYKSLRGNSSDKNPIVEDLGRAVQESRNAIIESIDNLIVNLNTQIASIDANTRQTNSKISGAPGQSKYLLSIERQQKVKEALYLYLLQKREENEVGQVFTPSNVRVISYARGSNIPVAPKRVNIMLVAFVVGLLIPVGVIFIYESLNDTVRYRSDLDMLTIPYLGDIPYYGKMRHRWERALGLDKKDKQTGFVVKQGGNDQTNEAFRIVRSNLTYMMKSKGITSGCKVIMVTSAIPHSGKTFVVQNLGAAYALKGKKVLLIDLDLRRHALSSSEGPVSHKGISNLLVVDDDIRKYIVSGIDGLDNLSMLPAGPMPPNPSELLENGRLAQLISELKTMYDIILLDCPPMQVVSDTQAVASLVDMTVFVIRIGLLNRDYLPEIEKIYNSGKYPNMSLLLNGVVFRETDGYNYGFGYSYGYSSIVKE